VDAGDGERAGEDGGAEGEEGGVVHGALLS
jgi:hypothetical protein